MFFVSKCPNVHGSTQREAETILVRTSEVWYFEINSSIYGVFSFESTEEDQSNKRNKFVNKSRSTQGVSGVSKIGSDQQVSKGQEASKEPPPCRSTPNRSAKRVPALPAVTDSQMDSLESNSTEDWASSKSHDDTIE